MRIDGPAARLRGEPGHPATVPLENHRAIGADDPGGRCPAGRGRPPAAHGFAPLLSCRGRVANALLAIEAEFKIGRGIKHGAKMGYLLWFVSLGELRAANRVVW